MVVESSSALNSILLIIECSTPSMEACDGTEGC